MDKERRNNNMDAQVKSLANLVDTVKNMNSDKEAPTGKTCLSFGNNPNDFFYMSIEDHFRFHTDLHSSMDPKKTWKLHADFISIYEMIRIKQLVEKNGLSNITARMLHEYCIQKCMDLRKTADSVINLWHCHYEQGAENVIYINRSTRYASYFELKKLGE